MLDKKIILGFFLLILGGGVLVGGFPATAETLPGPDPDQSQPTIITDIAKPILPELDPNYQINLGEISFEERVRQVILWLQYIFWVLAVGFVIWTAFLMLVHSGNEEKLQAARKRVLYAVIAAAIALLATGLKDIVYSFLTDYSQSGTPSELSGGTNYPGGYSGTIAPNSDGTCPFGYSLGVSGLCLAVTPGPSSQDNCSDFNKSLFTDVIINNDRPLAFEDSSEFDPFSGLQNKGAEFTGSPFVSLTLGDQTCHDLVKKTWISNFGGGNIRGDSRAKSYTGFQSGLGWDLCDGRSGPCPVNNQEYCVYAQFEYTLTSSPVKQDCITYQASGN